MHILFAEHHAMVRDGLRPFLVELSDRAKILEADCAAVVYRIISEIPNLDLAIIDHAMPGIELEDCVSTLAIQHPQARMVVLSPFVDPAVITHVMSLGIAGYIPKRLSARAFLSALRLVMDGVPFIPATLLETNSLAAGGGRIDDRRGSGDLLTAREREILDLLRQGLPNKLIARRLNVSEVTVKSHLGHVFRKLGVQNRVQAARFGDAGA